MNIATADKLVLRVRDGILFGGYQDDIGARVTLADGWYWATTAGDTTMWGPFGCSEDASEAAWNASTNGVEVHTYIDKGHPEFEIFKDSLPPGQDGAYLVGKVSKE